MQCSPVQVNPQASLSMSLAQTDYCKQLGFDPQSPLCAHIILSGSVIQVRTHTRASQASLQDRSQMTRSPFCPGKRDRGRLCPEGSVQSTPRDDGVAKGPRLVFRQVQHHTGTSRTPVQVLCHVHTGLGNVF